MLGYSLHGAGWNGPKSCMLHLPQFQMLNEHRTQCWQRDWITNWVPNDRTVSWSYLQFPCWKRGWVYLCILISGINNNQQTTIKTTFQPYNIEWNMQSSSSSSISELRMTYLDILEDSDTYNNNNFQQQQQQQQPHFLYPQPIREKKEVIELRPTWTHKTALS